MNQIRLMLEFLRAPRAFNPDKFILVLALCMSIGTIASYRYHFSMQNYSTFAIQQVLPAMQMKRMAEKATQRPNATEDSSPVRMDTWPWTSPLFRNQHHIYGEALIPIGSDYLGIWHYTKMLLEGDNPYSINFFFTYNNKAYDWPMIRDPQVPAQIVGPLSYPPFAVLVLVPFFSNNYFGSLLKYYFAIALFVIVLSALIVKHSNKYKTSMIFFIITTLITSYPIAFLLDRGNLEGIAFILVALALILYYKGYYFMSAIFIAIAASCKIHPAIFLSLFLLEKKWKEIGLGVATVTLLTFVSFLAMNAPIDLIMKQFINNISGVNEFFLFDGRAIQFSHTLCTLISGIFFHNVSHPGIQSNLRTFIRIYPYLVGMITVLIIWRSTKLDLRHRISVLIVMMLFLPYANFDYTLIYLLIPLFWLLIDMLTRESNNFLDVISVYLLVLLGIPKQYLAGLSGFEAGISFMINGLLLGLLLISLMLSRSPASSDLA